MYLYGGVIPVWYGMVCVTYVCFQFVVSTTYKCILLRVPSILFTHGVLDEGMYVFKGRYISTFLVVSTLCYI